MPMLSFQHYREISESDRLRRIGELIVTALIRYERDQRQRLQTQRSHMSSIELADLVTDPTEKEILQYLARVGKATPRDFRIALEASPMTITRRLARMRASGLIRASGETRAVTYRLANGERS